MSRAKVPPTTEADVLTQSRRRCCICFGLNGDLLTKKGQVAHLDHNPSNNSPRNLAWLCLDHHDQYDGKTSQSKNYTIKEVQQYRNELFAQLRKSQTEVSSAKSYRDRDLSQLRKVLTMINTSALDEFLHRIHLGHIPIMIFHFWEGFNAVLLSSRYHIHDPVLNGSLKKFHRSWAKCLSYGEWFTPTSSFQLLRLLSRHEVHLTKYQEWKATATHIEAGACRLEKSYKELLDYIRMNYKEIDLKRTDKVALTDYKQSVSVP